MLNHAEAVAFIALRFDFLTFFRTKFIIVITVICRIYNTVYVIVLVFDMVAISTIKAVKSPIPTTTHSHNTTITLRPNSFKMTSNFNIMIFFNRLLEGIREGNLVQLIPKEVGYVFIILKPN
jgi:hypothetical protein